VLIYLAGLAIGFLIGLVGGSKPRDLAAIEIRAPWVPLLAAGLEFGTTRAAHALGVDVSGIAPGLLIVAAGLGGVTVAVNPRYAGMWFVGAGLAANGLVRAFNGGRMPVAPEAIAALGADPQTALAAIAAGLDPVHTVLGEQTVLPWLADIIPIAPVNAVISLGDVLIVAGLGMIVTQAMRTGRARRLAARRSRQVSADDSC
jgi:hypothetical protein